MSFFEKPIGEVLQMIAGNTPSLGALISGLGQVEQAQERNLRTMVPPALSRYRDPSPLRNTRRMEEDESMNLLGAQRRVEDRKAVESGAPGLQVLDARPVDPTGYHQGMQRLYNQQGRTYYYDEPTRISPSQLPKGTKVY